MDRSIATAAAIARMPGHRVSTVYINTQGIADLEVESFLQRVANAGQAQFVRDAGGSLTVNLLLSLLRCRRRTAIRKTGALRTILVPVMGIDDLDMFEMRRRNDSA